MTFEPLRRGADFERLLKIRPCSSHGHFDLRHLADSPLPVRPSTPAAAELSTAGAAASATSVDDSTAPGPQVPDVPRGRWLGMIVPKRHARRAVSRQLIRRQIREALRRHATRLPGGIWVVRLRAGFDRAAFPSAASDPLRRAVGGELDTLFERALRRAAGGASPGGRGG